MQVAYACAHHCREEVQLQESLRIITSKVEEAKKETRLQLEEMMSDANTRLTSETDALRCASVPPQYGTVNLLLLLVDADFLRGWCDKICAALGCSISSRDP